MLGLRDAVRRGDLVLAKQLLDDPGSGAAENINKLENGSSCLHLAIGSKQIHVASLLLKSGADPDLPDSFGYAPIHLGVLVAEQAARRRRGGNAPKSPQKKSSENISLFESPSPVKEKPRVPLERADFNFLELLLFNGANPDLARNIVVTGEVVSTPLFEAVCLGELELVRLLLEHGADANIRGRARDSSYPEPALHVAARKDCPVQVCQRDSQLIPMT